MALDLSQAALAELAAAVVVPAYAREELVAGVVHIGLGAFHRAHQAVYVDDLLARGGAGEWAICGVSLTPSGPGTRDALRAQDHLYTVTEKAPDGTTASRVIGSLVDHLVAQEDPGAAVERLASRATRIVSLTITEGGYPVDPASGAFDPTSPRVAADLMRSRFQAPHSSAFGLLTEALRRRRDRGLGGVAVMSCDNVQDNGQVTRTALLGYAEVTDPQLAAWIEARVSFPGTMVDRVTPQTADADRRHLLEAHGYRDRLPVTCEPFRQWVLEDDFAAGRPELEAVGVQLVDDVAPYEVMKLRLANGTHQALAYFGSLLGYTYVHEAIADPDVHALLLRYVDEEAVPTLAPVAGIDPGAFGREVLERFSNPQIRDELSRVCAYASDRLPTFLLPVARARVAAGATAPVCAAVVASWARYAEGTDDVGRHHAVVDDRREVVVERARASRSEPAAFLDQPRVFGELSDVESFTDAYRTTLGLLHTAGARAALRALARQRVD